MNTRVRVIKRGGARESQSVPPGQDEKTGRESEREIACAVKSWIAESAQRRRAEEQCAFALLKLLPL